MKYFAMELTELEKAVIITIYIRGDRTKKAHFPVEFICKGFPYSTHQHGKVKKSVDKLKRKGYLYVKPHPSGSSYGLTEEGWITAKKLEKKE
ncbi:MAG: hypothetical protein ACLFVX_10840 [Archaeoglobaceae archaeon]